MNPLAPGGHGAFPSNGFTAVDEYNVAINAQTNDKVLLKWFPNIGGGAGYKPVLATHRANRFKGTLNGSFSTVVSTFSVTPIAGMDGYTPSGNQTVVNRYSWDKGTNGHPIEVLWDTVAGEWYPAQMRYDC